MNYVIVDLEATCWDGSRMEEMEIIEIGAVYLDDATYQPMRDFEQFVKPIINPRLSEFCKSLTNIQQHDVDSSPFFPEAYREFISWIGAQPFRLASWGEFDFNIFNIELQRCGLVWPSQFHGHINLKSLYARAYSTKASIGLSDAMRKLSMSFEGRLHRGIDDARNIARVAQTILMLDS